MICSIERVIISISSSLPIRVRPPAGLPCVLHGSVDADTFWLALRDALILRNCRTFALIWYFSKRALNDDIRLSRRIECRSDQTSNSVGKQVEIAFVPGEITKQPLVWRITE